MIKKLKIFYVILLIFITSYTFYYALSVISLNSPQEYRDDANIILVERLLKGDSIFTHNDMPAYANGYGIVYALFVLPFAKIFGISYVLLKIITSMFIVINILFIYFIGKKINSNSYILSTGLVILAQHLLFNRFDIGPRPDSLGLFLFLLTIFVPYILNFTNLSLFLSVIFAILSFFTKAYFVLGIVHVGIYLLLLKKYKKLLFYAIIFSLIFGFFSLFINYFMDFYFFNTLVIFGKVLKYMWWYQVLQFNEFTKINYSFSITFLFIFTILIIKRKLLINKYIFVSLLTSIALVVGKLGGNAGNWITYYTQFILPFAILGVSNLKNKYLNNTILILVLSNLIFLSLNHNYFVNTSNINNNWQEWENYLSDKRKIFNAPPFARLNLIQNGVNYDNGHTEYFHQGTPVRNYYLFKYADKIYYDQVQKYEKMVKSYEFDVCMFWSKYRANDLFYDGPIRDFIEKNYRFAGTKVFITAYDISSFDIWENPYRNYDKKL